jgi:hypothetical protein
VRKQYSDSIERDYASILLKGFSVLNFRAENGKKGEERPEQQAQDSSLEEEKQG